MKFFAIVTFLCLSACTPFVDRIKMSDVPPEEANAALAVSVFEISSVQPTNVTKYLGAISAFSCKLMMTDPPASSGDAIAQLRLKALRLGGNAVIGVTVDTRGTDTLGTNCWQSVQASGTAVIIPK